MSRKSLLTMYAFALMAMGDSPGGYWDRNPRSKVTPKKKSRMDQEKQNKAQGLNKYIIEGQEIWALNAKNAMKKFNKIKDGQRNIEKQQEAQMGYDPLLATEPCPNCKETVEQCACMRNICHKCGKPVGNITFTICDECWDIEFPPKS